MPASRVGEKNCSCRRVTFTTATKRSENSISPTSELLPSFFPPLINPRPAIPANSGILMPIVPVCHTCDPG